MANPTVTSIFPLSGPTSGGISVTITGTNFTGTTGVTIGGAAATSVSVTDDSTLTCTIPGGSAGSASVLVTNASGTNAANTLFTYQTAPTVTGVSPSSGPSSGGTSVTITGTNFIGASSVTFGGTPVASFTVVSSTSITCSTGSGSAGSASVVVTTPSGTNAANTLYTYVAAPTVSSISVSSGPTAGGTSVVITGTGFSGASSVSFGGTNAASFTVGGGGTTITCNTPGHSAGTVSVVVTTAGGTNAANSLYTYVAVPTVTGISVSSGPLGGGTSVTITGTSFTWATGVTFGGTAVTGFTVGGGGTTITCNTPGHAAGTVSVTVTNTGGSSGTNALYTYVVAPIVSSISPTSGTANGGTSVTITGSNFSGATGVSIGGAAATGVTVVNSTSITCTTPSGSGGTASVQVTTPGGTSAPNALFNFALTPPTVTAIAPYSGVTVGGSTVTITGTNLTAVSSVTFGGVAATDVTAISSTSLSCTIPAGSPGVASVLVTTPSGTNAANTLFTYVPPQPTVTGVSANGISPATGSTLGGTTVTVTGTDFTEVGGVTIGGVPATNVTVTSSTSLTCITPAGSVGTVSVVVATAGGTNEDNDFFTYALLAPTVSAITPNRGTAAGGTLVTISGANFTGATGVMIDGAAADRVIVLNDNTVTCITPAGSAGTAKSVVVSTTIGSNEANTLFTFVQALPTVSSVSPPIGAVSGATSVTLTGTHFSGATDVTFGGIPSTGITVVNDTTLTCTTPAGLAGSVSVLVTAAAGTSAANSLYLYVQAVPTDTYIYLKGGRGDGFVPLWTGALSEEGMVGDTGAALGTAGREVSDPYRDIHNYSTTVQASVKTPNNLSFTSGSLVLNGTAFKTSGTTPALNSGLTLNGLPAVAVYPAPYGVGPVPTSGTASMTLTDLVPQVSDEVAHEKPRQYARVATWLIFTSQSGISYKFRKDQVLGWGSQPRA